MRPRIATLLVFLAATLWAVESRFFCRRFSSGFFAAPDGAEDAEDCQAGFTVGETDLFRNYKTNQTFLNGFGDATSGSVCFRKSVTNECADPAETSETFGLDTFEVGLAAFNRSLVHTTTP